MQSEVIRANNAEGILCNLRRWWQAHSPGAASAGVGIQGRLGSLLREGRFGGDGVLGPYGAGGMEGLAGARQSVRHAKRKRCSALPKLPEHHLFGCAAALPIGAKAAAFLLRSHRLPPRGHSAVYLPVRVRWARKAKSVQVRHGLSHAFPLHSSLRQCLSVRRCSRARRPRNSRDGWARAKAASTLSPPLCCPRLRRLPAVLLPSLPHASSTAIVGPVRMAQ